jgi:hypothetical protein
MDYSKLDNVGREEALIQSATQLGPSSNIDPALESFDISYGSTTSSALNLPIPSTDQDYSNLLSNNYIQSSGSATDDEAHDTQSSLQLPSSDINPSESVSQTKLASSKVAS